MKTITQERLKAALTYDPETGIFTGKDGAVLGYDSVKGYLYISVNGDRFFAHRLAWLYVHGEMPKATIDHRNHDKQDNRIANLRDATAADNQRHRRGMVNKPLQLKGVRLHRSGAFQARITYEGARRSLGTYETADEAAHAYNKAAIDVFGEFAVLNPVGADY